MSGFLLSHHFHHHLVCELRVIQEGEIEELDVYIYYYTWEDFTHEMFGKELIFCPSFEVSIMSLRTLKTD